MELRAFAEQILFGTTLAEKLASPEAITDEQPGSAVETPAAPGRPVRLEFKPHATGKSDFPGLHRLEQEFPSAASCSIFLATTNCSPPN
jgi:hypothetical protein